ncbi:DUF1641 domain-containing protein [Flavilitoribacter nigricans]|uniref:DUF1641 domain-containing protein n=1 Tax=Flavilitoribacter nigricans (strain ATCC 23147 / DSM 23189 / NBRC 102662 / NCIMB 1420 / SS-2) TaxID=1122177 RepID=A0A2D0NBM5_FLAN2|nr:DUF1641 domain-containing protein [Flavilitoribacter nigricans]PHN05911.1 hypothetical protein CRP01_13090 [Flavilitoribacter nigricans DSM 23189 = NBRC 102662]
MEMSGNGTSVSWLESEAGKQVQARLSEPRTLEAIDHLLERIDTLETAVDKLSDALRQGPGMVAMVGDMVDEGYRQADAQGVSIDERLKSALKIAEKLTAPEMVAKIDGLISMTDQLPGMMAMVGDMADETYRQADARGVSIDQRLGVALRMAEQLTAPEMAAQLENALQLSQQMPGMVAMMVDMVDEGMKRAVESGFDPQTLTRVAGAANSALTEAYAEPPARVGGIFSMLRALKDPDRQKGMGFLLNFLKHFGQKI